MATLKTGDRLKRPSRNGAGSAISGDSRTSGIHGGMSDQMNDFARVMRLAFRQRMAIFGVMVSSAVIAAFWGINIGAIYPLVEVVFRGDSLPGYVQNRIVTSQQQIETHHARIAALETQLESAPVERKPRIAGKIQTEHHGIAAMERTIYWMTRIQPFINAYTPTEPYPTLLFLMGFLLVGTLVKLVALTSNLMLVQVVTERTAITVRSLFYRHALHLDLDDFGDTGSAQLTSRLTNDVGNLCGGVNTLLGRLVREPLKLIVCFGGAALVCWRLLLLVMIVSPLVAVVTYSLSRAIRRASRRVMSEMSQMYGMLSDSFAGIRLVKISNTQAVERAKFASGLQTLYQRSMKMAFYNTLSRSLSEFLGTVFVCLGIVAGGYLVVNQKTHLMGIRMSLHPLEVGQILLFFGFLIGASDPARKLAEVWSDLQRGIAAAERIFEVIKRPVRVRNPEVAVSPTRPHGMIRFQDVHFQYPSGPKVLSGVSLEIPHGQTIAVVGPNGCGKSTLISLLCRFDDPQEGVVLLDDTSLKEMRIRDVRRRIGLVTQRTTLFDDSIANNIAYGCPRASRSDIVRASKMAYADDFICNKTPDGYDTVLGGATGIRLSGGQMQRIALARAFLRDPDILILDEATSQIDLESEHLIHQALAKFLVDRTGIMITHRHTSLVLADQIVVMEEGRIADIGKHEDLLARNSFYQSVCGAESKMVA